MKTAFSSNSELTAKECCGGEESSVGGGNNTSDNRMRIDFPNLGMSEGKKNGGQASAAQQPPPPPLLKGILSYNLLARKHFLRGMWNYEASKEFPPQRFELTRTLEPDEDPTVLIKDGEFNGQFSLAYYHVNSKGKRKERSKIIKEEGVKIVFKKKEGNGKVIEVKGEGHNQYGIFEIIGTATKSEQKDEPNYDVELRKSYKVTPATPADISVSKKNKNRKRKLGSMNGIEAKIESKIESKIEVKVQDSEDEYPTPSKSYPENVVCLQGKLVRDASDHNGVIHKISGMWSSGLDLIKADPQNSGGQCNRFEYEHRCTIPTEIFPISGKYAGWFNLTTESFDTSQISERDVHLKFRKNSAGYYNVEGKGSNTFGKYTISGSLSKDNTITIFRHFQARKPRKSISSLPPTSLPKIPKYTSTATIATPIQSTKHAPVTTTALTVRAKQESENSPRISLDDVVLSDEKLLENGFVKPINPPEHGEYSALSRGTIRINDDGAHTCSGKWAISREHYNSEQWSNFHFGLEAHHATLAAEAMKGGDDNCSEKTPQLAKGSIPDSTAVSAVTPTTLGSTTFPVDSARYKGSFKMKRGTGKSSQNILDTQIVLKYQQSGKDSYNVHGKGVNSLGSFSLIGTLLLHTQFSGHVELYRIYDTLSTTLSTPEKESPPSTPPATSLPTIVPPSTTSHSTAAVKQGKRLTSGKKPLPTRKNIINEILPQETEDSSIIPIAAQPAQIRRESSRQTKLPSRLEDDDPKAKIARVMEKCSAILKVIRDKDISAGSFFSEPVDPVAHGIPTYHNVISNPMDLGTIKDKMDSNTIESPEEFAKLVRLVFQNAVKFNDDITHIVNSTARNLLSIFNQKFRDIERITENLNKSKKITKTELKELKRKQKEEKEKKRQEEKKRKFDSIDTKPEDPKKLKLKQIQLASEENAQAFEAIASLINTTESVDSLESGNKDEFNLMLQVMRRMQNQMDNIHSLVKDIVDSDLGGTNCSTNTVKAPKARLPNTVEPVKSPYGRKPKKKKVKEKADKPSVENPETTTTLAATASNEEETEEECLTLDEQQQLTDDINHMNEDKLQTIIDIIRESAALNEDEDEIDLEIDQLDTATQRKLQRFVFKNSTKKKPRRKVIKKQPSEATTPFAEPRAVEPKVEHPVEETKVNKDKTFSDFDTDSDSDSYGDEANNKSVETHSEQGVNTMQEDEDAVEGENITNWLPTKRVAPELKEDESGDEEDKKEDAWENLRVESEKQKTRQEERVAREEERRVNAEIVNKRKRAEAEAISKKKVAERKQKEIEERRLRELKEKEENEKAKKARAEAVANLDIQPTIDLDEQRDIMKKYEQSFCDKDLDGAGASPSSDFGF